MLTQKEIERLEDNELLTKIAEECAETIKAAMKFQRHGARPFFEGVQYDNFADVLTEWRQAGYYIAELNERFKL